MGPHGPSLQDSYIRAVLAKFSQKIPFAFAFSPIPTAQVILCSAEYQALLEGSKIQTKASKSQA